MPDYFRHFCFKAFYNFDCYTPILNYMKITEKIFALLSVIGLILMFSLIGGGAELMMISLLTLGAIYFPLGFLLLNDISLLSYLKKKQSFEKWTTTQIVLGVVTGIALSIVCIGILFKLLTLPGANEMLMFGVLGSIIISIVAIILKRKVPATAILVRTVIFSIVGITILFTSSLSIVKFQYRNHPAYVEAYTQYIENPKDDSLWEKQKLEYNRIWMSPEKFKEYEQELNEP
jgi:hypothetical protein